MVITRSRSIEEMDAALSILRQNGSSFGFIPRAAFVRSHEAASIVVLRLNQEVVAFCRFHDRRDGIRKLYEFVVTSEERRRGLGKKLLAHLEYDALASGAHAIELLCPQDSGANAFYERCGYRKIGNKTGKNVDLTIWRKP